MDVPLMTTHHDLPPPVADDELDTLQPCDIAAEQAVLGAMMLSVNATEKAISALSAGDFYRPAHGTIFTACAAAHRDNQAPDAITVKDRLESVGALGQVGGPPYLFRLIEQVPSAANVEHYAAIVRERAVRRRLVAAGQRVVQMARQQGVEAHGIAERAVREIEAVRDFDADEDITTPTIKEFLAVPDEDYDWVVPGLLERGDRMILTGQEGAGKTTLFRQLGVTIAAGIHPFTGAHIAPKRVLIVDCENGPAHTRRKVRPLVVQAGAQGRPVDEANLWLEIRPEGLDLALDRDVSWLMRRVALIQPDVVMVGPLYRMVPRALNTDDDVAPIIAVLNMIRARGACVLVEAHAGHSLGVGGRRDLRPRGSSALLGWPEFGYGIRFSDNAQAKQKRTVDLVPWRGDRDERDWPECLTAGGDWPWTDYVPGLDDVPGGQW
ncbi:AAA family ATPase [Actinomadura decatromicini]|uniref:AAA family ATPase n=2 Tax=Actinomadura decatromicini TaxID=2604572 RepID=A0A5D3FAU3_9ACTN|nr:AAA family ATPase [Actinomadura decatromicini]